MTIQEEPAQETVKPLGGKVSSGEVSPEYAAEQVEFQRYKNELNSLGPINSNEQAHKLRQILVKHNPKLAATFAELKLSII